MQRTCILLNIFLIATSTNGILKFKTICHSKCSNLICSTRGHNCRVWTVVEWMNRVCYTSDIRVMVENEEKFCALIIGNECIKAIRDLKTYVIHLWTNQLLQLIGNSDFAWLDKQTKLKFFFVFTKE